MNPRSILRLASWTLNLVADLDSLLPTHQLSLGRRLHQTHPGSFFGGTGDKGVEHLPNPAGEELRRSGFPHLALHLCCRIFLLGAMRRQHFQFGRADRGAWPPASVAFSSLWVIRSGNRRFGAVE